MTDRENANAAKAEEANAKEVAKVEATNEKAAAGTATTHTEALARGYFGTAMSRVPTEVHEAGSEKLRAELYGAAEVPDSDSTVDGPFASMEAAKKAIVYSNDLATVPTHPTLRGAAVNTAGDTELKKERK
jgi:hypothetical protein